VLQRKKGQKKTKNYFYQKKSVENKRKNIPENE